MAPNKNTTFCQRLTQHVTPPTCLVALCWGFTNPFIKNGSKGLENIKRSSWLSQAAAEYWYLFTRWQYVLPLVLNLCGSVVYYYTLGKADLSLAVPITNSLTFIFTTLAGILLGESIGSLRRCKIIWTKEAQEGNMVMLDVFTNDFFFVL